MRLVTQLIYTYSQDTIFPIHLQKSFMDYHKGSHSQSLPIKMTIVWLNVPDIWRQWQLPWLSKRGLAGQTYPNSNNAMKHLGFQVPPAGLHAVKTTFTFLPPQGSALLDSISNMFYSNTQKCLLRQKSWTYYSTQLIRWHLSIPLDLR